MTSDEEAYGTRNETIAREEILPLVTDDLIEEHRRDPFGNHSPELYKILTFLHRHPPEAGRLVVIVTDPHEEYALGAIPPERGEAPEILDNERYASQAEAEYAVFRKRVRASEERFGGPNSDDSGHVGRPRRLQTNRRRDAPDRGEAGDGILRSMERDARQDDPIHGELRRPRAVRRSGRQTRPCGPEPGCTP